jgi:hypothetical protein
MKIFLVCAFFGLSLVSGGCGEKKGSISGKVTFDGKPLPAGRITFLSQESKHISKESIIVDGAYSISDFPAGPVIITGESFPPPKGGEKSTMPKDLGLPPPGREKPKTPEGKYVPIPPRYGNMEESGLTYTVLPGEQEHDVPLPP